MMRLSEQLLSALDKEKPGDEEKEEPSAPPGSQLDKALELAYSSRNDKAAFIKAMRAALAIAKAEGDDE